MVTLLPLEQRHFDELAQIAADPRIWEHYPTNGSNADELKRELGNALLMRSQGSHYPFAIIDTLSGKVIGSTRFFEIFPEHKKLEIGWTWYAPEYWGSGHNTECKLLLLTYCFEVLNVQRVQLKTRDSNKRSAAAILKIGAKYEGTLRKDRILHNGITRDTMMFSILDEEWEVVKEMLEGMIS